MAKINIKLDKQFFSELTGSLNKSSLDGNKKLLSLFDLINNHKKDDTIDVKEITDFANSIFAADTNNDGEVDKTELETYVKNNEDKFKELKIKAKDILEFLNNFRINSDKTDTKNQRITNDDGSYSIVYEEVKEEDIKTKSQKNNEPNKRKYTVTIKQNLDSKGNLISTEETRDNKTTITDANGNFVTEQIKDKGKVISERKVNGHTYKYDENGKVTSETKTDGLTYYYEDKKTVIKKGNILVKEIITLDNGQVIVKEYDNRYDKRTITTTNETTGEVTKETIYSDTYYLTVKEGGATSVGDMKNLINNPISANALQIFLWNEGDIISAIAKEDDNVFKKTYITGMVNKAIEIANFLGIKSDELKTIQKEIKEKGFENVSVDKISTAYSMVFKRIEQQNPECETSRISNGYYTSKHSYTKISTSNKIIILDSENNKTVIDKNNLLRVYSQHDKNVMWSVIKDFSAEVLVDIAAEATFRNVAEAEGAGASFNPVIDRINIGDIVDPDYILHELGHAIDCKGKGSVNNYQSKYNKNFLAAFRDDMKAFEAAGNKRCIAYYDQKGGYHTKNDFLVNAKSNNNSTYATIDEQEMFADCYALLMGGTCQSEEVINKYFRNTLACVQEIVESTRKLPKSQRHIA